MPIRIICYDTGALLLLLLSENGIEFQREFIDTPFAESLLAKTPEYSKAVPLSMQKTIDAYFKKAADTVDEAIVKGELVNSTPCEILGVNVYNAVYYNNHIITRFFVMYDDGDSPKIEYGDFLIETKEYKKSSRIYRI